MVDQGTMGADVLNALSNYMCCQLSELNIAATTTIVLGFLHACICLCACYVTSLYVRGLFL